MSINVKAPIVLASNSPRRHDLLSSLGLEFEVFTRDVYEYIPEDVHPRAVAVMVSENKAKAYDDVAANNLVITADTLVALEDKIMGKPADAEVAYKMLKRLSGRTHTVITGVTLFHEGRFKSFSEETYVTFRRLNDSEINYYIEKYEPFDKAGSYGIQEWIGMIGVTRIEGDYFNVMGLPTAKLYAELIQFEA
ncbi:MAG: Maf family nucleotide pyrophosphatase [Bacteroidota bacterium]